MNLICVQLFFPFGAFVLRLGWSADLLFLEKKNSPDLETLHVFHPAIGKKNLNFP